MRVCVACACVCKALMVKGGKEAIKLRLEKGVEGVARRLPSRDWRDKREGGKGCNSI